MPVDYRWIRSNVALAAAAVMLACADAAGSDAIDAAAIPRLTLVEEVRIGSSDNPDTGFSSIGGVDVDRDGNVYAVEIQRAHIRVYDPQGRLFRTIGRRGQGPGEFESAPRLAVIGDTIWTFEPFRDRATLFDRRGTVLATARIEGVRVDLQGEGRVGYVLPSTMHDDSLLLGHLGLWASRAFTGTWPIGPTDTVPVPRVRFRYDGSVVDTIGWDSIPPPDPEESSDVRVGSTRYYVPRPAREEARAARLRGGRVVADAPPPASGDRAIFTVTRLGLAGDTVFHGRFAFLPTRYAPALLDSLVWRSVRMPGGGYRLMNGMPVREPPRPDSMAAFDAIHAALNFPEYQSPVQELNTFGDGEIWLRREDDGGPYRWLLLAPDGRVRGEVELPRNHRVVWNEGDTVWIIEPDAVDVPWLVRRRIEAAR